MSNELDKTGGIVRDVFDPDTMQEWQEYFQKWQKTGDDRLNCYGIDDKNQEAERWFQSRIFSKVQEVLNNPEMRSIFGMYAESVKPYIIHSDSYHVEKNGKSGQPHLSWLIPYKVDGSQKDLSMASTIIFNEVTLDQEKNQIEESLIEKYFTHCDRDSIKRLSIYKVLHWEPGSLIYWNQHNLHCSGSFNGFSTKEMFVGHTFMPG